MLPKAARRVFLWLLLGLSLSTGGHLYAPDAVLRGRVTEALLRRGALDVDPAGIPAGFLAVGRGGKAYPKYEAGASLAAVPFFLFGDVLGRLAPHAAAPLFQGPLFLWYRPDQPRDAWHFFGLGLTNAMVVAATGALLFVVLLHLGYGGRAALWATGLAVLASPLWVYSKDLFAEPLAGLGLLVFVWAAEREAREQAPRAAALCGLGLGLAVLAKTAHVVLLPGALAVLVWRWRGLPGHVTRLARFTGGLAVMLGLAVVWNVLRFGDPWASGYGSELELWITGPLEGLAGLLVSPGRGLFTYFPAAFLALACTRASYRRAPQWTVFAWLSLVALLALYCRWHGWDGGWCFGPRFLVPLLPLLALVVAPFFSAAPRARWARAAGWSLIGLSAAIAFTGTLVAYTDFHQALRHLFGSHYLEVARWDWRYYAPVAYWGFEPKLFWIAPRVLRVPAAWWLAAAFGAGFVALVPLARGVLAAALGPPGVRVGHRRNLAWSLFVLAGAVAGAALALSAG